MAVTEQQIGVYMSERRAGKQQVTAAAKTGLSERTARRIEQGKGGVHLNRGIDAQERIRLPRFGNPIRSPSLSGIVSSRR